MKPEEWQRVKQILESALEMDPASRTVFLDRACAGNEHVRREVESLLAQHNEADGILGQPAFEILDGRKSEDQNHLAQKGGAALVGQMLSDYEIVEKLGAGGMGEVYRARDTRLGRDVAIKVLPSTFSRDPERLRRFEQEARAAAALNHPNILAVFQLGTYDGAPYMVSELLEGSTLREQLLHGPIPIRKAIDYAAQVARGLAAAHKKGVVHRDLKPENLFVTTDGRAKILDFGLAKLTQRQSDLGSSVPTKETEPGVVLGTVGYMSPEQVSGDLADHRADIFAFGAILYEILTAKRAFHKPTAVETMSAILTEDPPEISRLAPATPLSLQRLVARCLDKNPEQRFQSASDLAFALEAVSESGSSARGLAELGVGRFSLGRASVIIIAVVIAVAVLASVAEYLRSHSNPPTVPAKITQISQWNKPMNSAKLSSDGHAVAFVSPVSGVGQVFLMLTSGVEPLQLTNDQGDKVVENFSSDSREVYYRRSFGRDEVWAVPALGGSPRRVTSGRNIVSSFDGSSLYYVKSDSSELFRAEKSGLNEEPVFTPKGTGLDYFPLLLFPGGNDLLVASRRGVSSSFRLHKINLKSREATELGEVSGDLFDIVWDQPGETVLFSRTVNGLTNIWTYALRERILTQITFGPGPDFSPMRDPGGRGIYFINGKSTGALTAYDVHSKKTADIVPEDATQPIISPDGKRVMYVTLLAKDRNELWVANIDGSSRVKIATAASLFTNDWAADGFHLTFCETQADGTAKIYVVAADGTGLRRLPSLGNGPMNSVWSPDQHFLYVSGTEKASSTPTIWKVNIDGSNPEKFVEDCGAATDVDPRGKYLLSMIFQGERMGVYDISLGDKKCRFLLQVPTFGAVFARDGRSFLYHTVSRNELTIYRQLWKDGELTGTPQVELKLPVTFPLSYDTNASDFSRDLSTIVYARPGGHTDLYLVSVRR